MSQVIAAPPVAAAPAQHGALARDALGLPAVLFCIVTGAAPLAAMMFNVPVAVSGGGYAVPAAFLVATIALTIFSTGYIEMSQRVTSTGGFYTFISRGLGNVLGPRLGHPDRALLRDLRRGGDRRARLLRVDHVRRLVRHQPARLRLHVRRARADDRVRVVPHRADGEDPRRRARGRGARAAGAVRRDHRLRRRAGRLQRRAAEPGQHLRQRRRAEGLRRRGRRRGDLRRLLVLGRLRDGAQLRRGVARAAQDRQGRDLRQRDRPRRLLHLRLATCSSPAGA